ncbi:MAG TPA: hypothetical protein VIV63_07900 [Steroidobacteraceae bacterium]
MDKKRFIGLAGLAVPAAMLGCSTSKPTPSVQTEAIEWRSTQLIPPPPAMEPRGQFCLLGTTCLAMDPRPFEPCLLSTKHCGDKAREPMEVAPPREVPDSGAEASRIITVIAPQ